MKTVSKRVGIVKKAQTGVQVSKKDMDKHPEDFKFLKTKKTVKKAQSGSSLGMKSVKAGVDSNPSVTRADIITAGKQNAGKAKSGKKLKSGGGVSYASAGKSTGHTGSGMLAPSEKNLGKTKKQAKFKSGGSMKKCKGGC